MKDLEIRVESKYLHKLEMVIAIEFYADEVRGSNVADNEVQ